jgi:imidazolonepropionase-like amidohydrolase
MFDVMRSFVDQNAKAKVKGATYVKALNRATNSGAQILKVDKKKGNFEVGKQANFIAVDYPKLSQKTEDAELILKKVINTHKNDRDKYQTLVKSVFYNGEKLD